MSCCSAKGCDEFFTDRVARRNVDTYRRKGLDKHARRLVDAVCRNGIEGRTVLEVGGGIGAIQLELLRGRGHDPRTSSSRPPTNPTPPSCCKRPASRAASSDDCWTSPTRRNRWPGGCRHPPQGRLLLPRLRGAHRGCRRSRQASTCAHLPTQIVVDAARIYRREPARAAAPEDVPRLCASPSGDCCRSPRAWSGGNHQPSRADMGVLRPRTNRCATKCNKLAGLHAGSPQSTRASDRAKSLGGL